MRLAQPSQRSQALCLYGGALLLLAVGVSVPASAHPGHDHAAPAGVWPAHASADVSAGTAALTPFRSGVLSSPVTQPDVRIDAWKLATGATGTSPDADVNAVVSNVVADVNTVAYDDDYVFIRTSGVPSHSVGPVQNPTVPGDLDATYRIARNPVEETGVRTESLSSLGPIGVMVNGAAFYSPSDGTYWRRSNNTLTNAGDQPPMNTDWSTNALWRRADGMDAAGGHPSPVRNETNPDGSQKGLYHYHRLPTGLSDQIDPDNDGSMGSPVFGFAFDGYPIVGPYAYEEQPGGAMAVVQMTSSYAVADASIRGANGPSVADYELGSFLEDFEYVAGSGTLNEYNMAYVRFDDGRAVLTDETDPDGDWAYFLTFDALAGSTNDTTLDREVAWPYIVGPEFFGVADPELIGPGGATIIVPGDVAFEFEQLTGDYNRDGLVDAADYTAWRDAEGDTYGALANDPTGESIGPAQEAIWRGNYGSTVGTASLSLAAPEPTTAGMTLMGLLTFGYRRHRGV